MTNTFQECINYSKYGGLDFNRLRSDPFEGPAIVIPPALPEDTYFLVDHVLQNIKWLPAYCRFTAPFSSNSSR